MSCFTWIHDDSPPHGPMIWWRTEGGGGQWGPLHTFKIQSGIQRWMPLKFAYGFSPITNGRTDGPVSNVICIMKSFYFDKQNNYDMGLK